MHKLTRWLVVLGMALLAGCASAPSPTSSSAPAPEKASEAAPGEIFTEKHDGALLHVLSGFSFPTRLGNFERGAVNRYNERGDDVSVGYNERATMIVATLYVYPTHGSSLDDEFARRQDEVTNFGKYSDVHQVSTGSVDVTPKKVKAMQATYTFTAAFAGKVRPVESQLLVAKQGDWFIEYRISYPAANHNDALPKVRKLAQTFAWP